MKHQAILPLLFVLCFFAHASTAFAQTEFGVRLHYQTVFAKYKSDASEGLINELARPGFQAGVFAKKHFSPKFALRAELNYSLAGYFKKPKETAPALFLSLHEYYHYQYVGFSAIPEIQFSKTFSAGAGMFANVLVNNPGDFSENSKRPRFDGGVLAAAFLRYRQIEIQARYQFSLTSFIPKTDSDGGGNYFHTIGAGLAYFF